MKNRATNLEATMHKNKKDNKNQRNDRTSKEEGLELSLEKAVKAIRQQANDYHQAGLTHISSLLD